jgi:phytoene dehydrogenase-like protein
MNVVIVGGGIAGLYAALKIAKQHPDASIQVLEKEAHLGGRAGTQSFVGTTIMTGAGVGRKDKDKRLRALLVELGVKYTDFVVQQQHSPAFSSSVNVKKTFYDLRRTFRSAGSPRVTFKSFAENVLGKELYALFVAASGYSDYEQEDAMDTLYHYGFEDNFTSWKAMGINWKELISVLATKLVQQYGVKIMRSVTVTRLDPDKAIVYCNNNKSALHCDLVILATTVDVVKRLLYSPIYQTIHGQPFLRIYGQFSAKCRALIKEAVAVTTVVPTMLHKLIPIHPDKGVYMIAYTDNADATRVERLMSSSGRICRLLEQSLALPSHSLELLHIAPIQWDIGTHYYGVLPPAFRTRREFIHAAQRPYPRVRVVGEMVAMNQGWVEGALESVERIFRMSQ